MILYLVHFIFQDHLIANLFHYISFRALMSALLAFVLTMFLMPRLIAYLTSRSVQQMIRDDGPQSHLKKVGTPTMGGLMMLLGILVSSLLFCRLDIPSVWISLGVLVSFGIVGFLDDYLKLSKKNTKGVSFRAKMLSLGLLSILATIACLQYAGIKPEVFVPFFKTLSIDLGFYFLIWGFLLLCGSSNAVNLTDGLDGLAIVPIMTTAAVLLITSYISGHAGFATYLQFHYLPGAGELSIIMASVIGVGLGFLWFNSHPAQVFMGDVGSLSLGGLLSVVAMLTQKEFIFLMAGLLFVIEALSVMAQVGFFKWKKRRIFKMAPIHHHFELSGWPESKVIVRFWIISILFAFVALSALKIR